MTPEQLDALTETVFQSGISIVDALRNMGEDVMYTPDGEIANIVDAMPCEPLSESEYSVDASTEYEKEQTFNEAWNELVYAYNDAIIYPLLGLLTKVADRLNTLLRKL